MEAAAVLVRLGERLKIARGLSKQKEGKELLAWVQAGGIDSLKEGLVAFLTAAATQPAGSVFYTEEPPKEPEKPEEPPQRTADERHDIAVILRERFGTAAYIFFDVLGRSHEEDISPLAYYLAGAGLSDEQIRNAEPQELKNWTDDIPAGTSNITTFLKGYDDEELDSLAEEKIGVNLLFNGKDSPILLEELEDMVHDMDSFKWYLAGNGYTYALLEHQTAQNIRDLVVQFEEAGSPEGLDAFLAGYEAE